MPRQETTSEPKFVIIMPGQHGFNLKEYTVKFEKECQRLMFIYLCFFDAWELTN